MEYGLLLLGVVAMCFSAAAFGTSVAYTQVAGGFSNANAFVANGAGSCPFKLIGLQPDILTKLLAAHAVTSRNA